MKINRHNYEEYFILYLDNELSSDDRRLVEEFVQRHPDLNEELNILLQYKLVPDTQIVFERKEELMKDKGLFLITDANYEEWLTPYIDQELSAGQIKLVEQYLASHPAAQKDLALFRQTRLQPENIVFADKASLYRREEKARRIIPLRWWAAAAVLILLLGATTLIVLNRPSASEQNGVAGSGPGRQRPAPVQNNSANNEITRPAKEDNTAIAAENKNTALQAPFAGEIKSGTEKKQPVSPQKPVDRTRESLAVKEPAVPGQKLPENSNTGMKKEDALTAEINNKPSNNLPQPLNNPNAITGSKPDNALAYTKPDESMINHSSAPDVTKADTDPSSIIPAGYAEPLEQPDGKKNKNRGIFRKIARTFEKRTSIDPTDDNRLLVAGLAIKLK